MTDTNEPGPTAAEPRTPEFLPKYIGEGLPKQDIETLRDAIAYAEELIEYKNRPLDSEDLADESEDIVDVADDGPKGKIVIKKVTCGDETCHCITDDELHGPYKYRHYRDESGKSTAEYLGKV